ncbi:hypothetical protein BE20_21620 [Sorangium cellulosum]|uniref:ABC transporter substrate-binding protein n=1 Tax=Sorangium cellulosum TaxID=56 RepID=A0A150S950_SORCE|nr:hypothetical protein BE18_50200 [Sorangium cellulosum]KYF88932.1 hypothetical protein BE20_21620 [Sorangium cellulosum]
MGQLASPARIAHRWSPPCARPNDPLAAPVRPGTFRRIAELLAARLAGAFRRPRRAVQPPRAPAALLAAALLLGSCLLLLSSPLTAGPEATLYVYAVTPLRARALEQKIEDAMPGVDVTVFGKLSDFKTALEVSPPNAALSPRPVLTSLNRGVDLQGLRAGSDAEQYLLVSTKLLARDMLSSFRYGIVDLVERKSLPRFVAGLLGVNDAPEVQRVTKIEDLLQLLQFQTADAVLLPERFRADFESKSKMSFTILSLSTAKVGLVAVTFLSERQSIEGAIRRLPKHVLADLGVDEWR